MGHQAINSLHGVNEAKDWLCRPSSAFVLNHQFEQVKRVEGLVSSQEAQPLNGATRAEIQREVDTLSSANRWQVASWPAAMMLVAPVRLLILALNAFLIGLGIYLGIVYTAQLNPFPGTNGSLAVLIFYLIATSYGLALFYTPQGFQTLESGPSQSLTGSIHELRLKATGRLTSQDRRTEGDASYPMNHTRRQTTSPDHESVEVRSGLRAATPSVLSRIQVPDEPHESSSTDPFMSSLQALLRAQEQSAQASRALLQEYQRTRST